MISGEQGKVWKNIEIDDKVHVICFIKAVDTDASWKVFLTDLTEIWEETLTQETMFHKCQVLELITLINIMLHINYIA